MQSSHCDSSVAIFEMEISFQFEIAPSSKHQKASASTLDYRVGFFFSSSSFFPVQYVEFNYTIPFRGEKKNLTPLFQK